MTGSTGRLGSVVNEMLIARGDNLHHSEPINYLIFAHRYRGEPDFSLEMDCNVNFVAELVKTTKWAEGDKAIVIVSSVNAETPTLDQSIAYNVSKAALNNLARYFALSGPVRCNTVSPDTFTGDNPKVTPQQVAEVIGFLCSPQASGINGQDLRVTG